MHPFLTAADSSARPWPSAAVADWSRFVEANPIPSWGMDPHGNNIIVNSMWSALTGQAPLSTADLQTLIHPEDRSSLHDKTGPADETAAIYEYRLRRADGSFSWVRDTITAVLNRDNIIDGYLGCTQILTDARLAEAQARASRDVEILGSLASGVAHDFNNQITAVRMFADILRSNLRDERNVELVDQIVHSCSSAEFLIKKLNSFSRHEVVQPELVELNALIENLRSFVRSLLPDEIEINIQLETQPQWVEVDRKQIEQVFFNLCLNAREAMSDAAAGTLTIKVERLIAPAPVSDKLDVGTYVRLTVADTGRGIESAELDRVFDPFYTTKSKNKGTGLGLANCRRIAHEARGDVQIESAPGQGTQVFFWLPASQDSTANPPAEHELKPPAKAAIMLVDDDDLIRNVAETLIDQLGHDLVSFNRAEAAVEYADREGIDHLDLLITDIAMPGMDGHELVRNFRKRRGDILVLFISGFMDNPATQAAVDSEKSHFLPKPFSCESLQRKLTQLLPRSKS
jgi:two-component system, cell cycle sensor histidine kinase and response regulator CckA